MSETILFRTDGSAQVGFGHVRRCLTLASALRNLGESCAFVLDGSAEAAAPIEAAGFDCARLPANADAESDVQTIVGRSPAAVVLDSYCCGGEFCAVVKRTGAFLIAIRDTPEDFAADMVVNAAAPPVPGKQQLFGPAYALLRPEFAADPRRGRKQCVERVLITMGGGDSIALSMRLVEWLRPETSAAFDVMVGPLAARGVESSGRIDIHRDPANVHELMLRADLAVSASGQTLFELAATATPTIAVLTAANQQMNLDFLAGAGVVAHGGVAHDDRFRGALLRAYREVANDAGRRVEMSRRARALVDGGGAGRVAEAIAAAIGNVATRHA